ncbi:hypothetical protein, partial [Blastomonas fulva]|uniref:hypothetical protein n=1 Tax=Blastomonas fulva TaxID=1550728 RepID=UPI0040376E72
MKMMPLMVMTLAMGHHSPATRTIPMRFDVHLPKHPVTYHAVSADYSPTMGQPCLAVHCPSTWGANRSTQQHKN